MQACGYGPIQTCLTTHARGSDNSPGFGSRVVLLLSPSRRPPGYSALSSPAASAEMSRCCCCQQNSAPPLNCSGSMPSTSIIGSELDNPPVPNALLQFLRRSLGARTLVQIHELARRGHTSILTSGTQPQLTLQSLWVMRAHATERARLALPFLCLRPIISWCLAAFCHFTIRTHHDHHAEPSRCASTRGSSIM